MIQYYIFKSIIRILDKIKAELRLTYLIAQEKGKRNLRTIGKQEDMPKFNNYNYICAFTTCKEI